MVGETLFHEPVLKKEILAFLIFENARTIFDGTLGLGGHAEAILKQFPRISHYVACDLDQRHLAFARKRLKKWHQKAFFYHANFSEIKKIVQELDIPHPLVILLDLGLCSVHVDDPERGFSFSEEGPLNMAFDSSSGRSCADILNTASERELIQILRDYGEEPRALKLAQKIIARRQEKPFEMTSDLRQVIEENAHPRDQKKTLMRVFQAFRIAVNDELDVLRHTLEKAIETMRSGDRMGVISYHSLEDRIVKQFFVLQSRPETEETEFSRHSVVAPAKAKLLTKKPIVPSEEEISQNPRARSARLRILEKIT